MVVYNPIWNGTRTVFNWNIWSKRGETSVEEGGTLAEGAEDIPQGYLGKDQQRVKVLHVQVIDWLSEWFSDWLIDW